MTTKDQLQIGKINDKLRRLLNSPLVIAFFGRPLRPSEVRSLALLAGHACPGAKDCLARVIETLGKRSLERGDNAEFQCFSASQELQYSGTFKARRRNFEMMRSLKSTQEILDLFDRSIPDRVKLFRFWISGDFFNLRVLLAAIALANMRPDTHFYTYTKSLHLLRKIGRYQDELTDHGNLRINLSRGGVFDRYLPELQDKGFAVATVVNYATDQPSLGPIDRSDDLAAFGHLDPTVADLRSFRLTIHGPQVKGSIASKASHYNARNK